MTILLAASLLLSADVSSPAFVLEPVGIEFGYLPEYLTPLVEGVMTEETGVLTGQINSNEVYFGCHYWLAEEPVTDKNLWIQEKLSSVLPPDFMTSLHTGTPTWSEGSMLVDVPSHRSLGLMSEVGFTFSPIPGLMGRGKAYGIFRNGYSVLLVIYGPSAFNAQHELTQIVGMAVLSD